jgi:hypothetical protein
MLFQALVGALEIDLAELARRRTKAYPDEYDDIRTALDVLDVEADPGPVDPTPELRQDMAAPPTAETRYLSLTERAVLMQAAGLLDYGPPFNHWEQVNGP